MDQLLAKFKVGSVVNFGNNNVEANLSAVTNTSEENKSFSIYTPSASLKMHITNPQATNFFEPGEEYVCTFTKAEKS
jgi:GH35 family endo-1,4-beta-xylanase